MDLSGEGWAVMLASRARDAQEWTQWLHQSAWATDEPVAGLIGALRPRNYAHWEPLFDLVQGTVLFPFDVLPRSCCLWRDSATYSNLSLAHGRYPYTPCSPTITRAQARAFEEQFGPFPQPQDDPIFYSTVPPTESEEY